MSAAPSDEHEHGSIRDSFSGSPLPWIPCAQETQFNESSACNERSQDNQSNQGKEGIASDTETVVFGKFQRLGPRITNRVLNSREKVEC